jgi:2-(1,2-epoxy-1,2-dihydrophenyl)acetyl-CoA isomerase
MDHVTVTRTEGVGRITLNRPEKNNSMNAQTARELHEAAIELVEDDAVRCIVLTGTGNVFHTGADLGMLDLDESDGALLREVANDLHAMVSTLHRAPKPVVCGVNGVTAGGGIGPALCGDIVLMAESARFQFAYPAIALSADGGSSYFLPRLVGLRKAQEIAMRNESVGSAEAEDIGLVTEVVPDDEFEARLAEEAAALAEGPTLAHAGTKRLLRTSLDRQLSEQMEEEAETIVGLTKTGDYQRGVEAFFEKEQAEFEGE